MDADMGGTEILQPLKNIYSNPTKPEYSRQVSNIQPGLCFCNGSLVRRRRYQYVLCDQLCGDMNVCQEAPAAPEPWTLK